MVAAGALVAATLWVPAGVHHLGEWRRRGKGHKNFLSLALVALALCAVVGQATIAATLIDPPSDHVPVAAAVVVVNLAASTVYLLALAANKRRQGEERREL